MHDHGHGHHHGHHHGHAASSAALLLALGLTLGFSFVEALAGWWAGSLALLGDAGHMLTDSFALGLAAVAARLSQRPPSQRLSYGLGRMEALAALINGLLMIAVVAAIVWHAVERLLSPQTVAGGTVTVVALIGLLINIAAAWLLSRGGNDLNTRAALLHVMGDLLGSVAALAAGLIIQFTGWMPIDPLLSVLICGLILASTLSLLRQVFTTLLEGVPESLSLPEVGRSMAAVDGIVSVHDLHIWSLGAGRVALSAHVVIASLTDWPTVLPRLQTALASQYGIEHATLQPEIPRAEPIVFKRKLGSS
ncbi:MAG: cation transporter [Zoogloeaceae bacterium]|uniref:cation diffusion facilitator family transporter n=1 Tax=Denitromonas sp. TaxID=2734609 RepID=UPI001D90121D|nr:cation transporter [Rhodocyclaceae bacterium]MCP5220673.1 cation transporter [Zoogloeaceae bacterium]HPR05169.1 cation diffusion facilitator family transporter [Denitromonas sp.]